MHTSPFFFKCVVSPLSPALLPGLSSSKMPSTLRCQTITSPPTPAVYSISASGRFVGESEGALRGMFAEASRKAPCLIVLDEVDTLCPRRDEANSEAQRRVVSTMLALLDGVDDKEQVRACDVFSV